ncbi:hypothetical protein EA154_17550, partial [Enterobacter hormaechei subsp. hoffmannii]
FFSAHEVSTCKISGCLSYRILDSGPDGTQTTLTFHTPSLIRKILRTRIHLPATKRQKRLVIPPKNKHAQKRSRCVILDV